MYTDKYKNNLQFRNDMAKPVPISILKFAKRQIVKKNQFLSTITVANNKCNSY